MVADLQWGNLTNYQPENVFILSFSYIAYCPSPSTQFLSLSAFHVVPPRPCMIYILTSGHHHYHAPLVVTQSVASETYHDWSGKATGAQLRMNFTLK